MGKTELFLALARSSFLTCQEKAFFANKLDNLESLTVLSIEDICRSAGRCIRTRVWNPDSLPDLVSRDLGLMERYGICFATILSGEYPPLLREIPDPPFAVFWRGSLPDPECPMTAIVGTRTPSGDGALAAARFGREFAAEGIPVVSGLARGIDAYAHRGSTEAHGISVAVLACGVDRIYPRSNARLAARVLELGGCVISEYSPGETPLQYRFPQRNRIISGLSRAVVIVEAPQKSGALITADFALEQGRDLFVVRDALGSSVSAGCRSLHEQGAPAISSARDVLGSWGYESAGAGNPCPRHVVPVGMSGLSRQAALGRQLALEFGEELHLRQKRVH